MSTSPPPPRNHSGSPGYSGNTLVAISAVFIALESIFVALRLYARRLTPSAVGWDDVLVPVAWLANLGLCVVGVRMTMISKTGDGHNLAPAPGINPKQQVSLMKYLLALILLHLSSVALPKIAILYLYLRIFVKRGTRITCYVVIGVITANWIAFVFAATFQCSPVAYQWDKSIAHGKCFNVDIFSKASSAPNIITDVVMLALPIPILWKLQVSPIRKFGLTLVFLTGSVGIIGSSVREMAFSTHIQDKSRSFFFLTAWSIIEAGMYLIAACLLALRPIFSQPSLKWLMAYVSGGRSRKPTDGLDDSNSRLELNASAPAHSHHRFTEIPCTQDEKAVDSETPFHHKSKFSVVQTYEYDMERGFAHSSGPSGKNTENDPRIKTPTLET